MNRRQFLRTLSLAPVVRVTSGVAVFDLMLGGSAFSQEDFVSARSTLYKFQHFHQLAVPVSVLIDPPKEGFVTRTSEPEQDSVSAILVGMGLGHHTHQVVFSQAQLLAISLGHKDVEIEVFSPTGGLAHKFSFTAPSEIVNLIVKARSSVF